MAKENNLAPVDYLKIMKCLGFIRTCNWKKAEKEKTDTEQFANVFKNIRILIASCASRMLQYAVCLKLLLIFNIISSKSSATISTEKKRSIPLPIFVRLDLAGRVAPCSLP